MSRAFNSRYLRSQAGASSLEFALVAIPFLFLLLAGLDLGRYFMTRHALRTLVTEAARLAVINCAGRGECDAATALPAPAVAWAMVPFLDAAGANASLSAQQTVDQATGITTVVATASYEFAFVLPAWTGMNGTFTETLRWNH